MSNGATGLKTPRIIFGSMARGAQDDAARVEVLQCAITNGLTTIDTAPLYDFGQAERQIALATKSLPHHAVQIFTKVGLRWDAGDHGDILFEFTDKDGSRRAVRRNSRPESICWEVEQSLERLQLETLDLVQIHQPDEHTPVKETMSALLDLRSAGKIRHIGVSNFSPAQIKTAQQALGEVPLASTQNEYSLVRRQIEAELLPLCRARNIGVLAYSPLAAGALTGSSKAQITQPMQEVIDNTLQPLAAEHGVSPAAIALAWVCQQPGVTAAIAGASTTAQVLQQANALDLTLAEQTLNRLTTEFARSPLEYPEFPPKGIYRKTRRLVGIALRKLRLRK